MINPVFFYVNRAWRLFFGLPLNYYGGQFSVRVGVCKKEKRREEILQTLDRLYRLHLYIKVKL